eukprot:CAMPEP_0184859360 /NCGR_PEP_ID=MMETSP0580-20130426/4369_1 /TAXON_ID=1118495 /ORGANISM="Dactyliosolen fragilissimus" /LENGTH=871 /DNA_ID=CAMNT_0027355957 /DNA_START=48 /DNA_END=2664 /DNA_ORIENTATION=+
MSSDRQNQHIVYDNEFSHKDISGKIDGDDNNKHRNSAIPSSSVPLGCPIPLDEHACSVSLPTWSSVVGYEEGDPYVTSKLTCGYPRFVYHPYIMTLMKEALKMDEAKRCQKVSESTNNEGDIQKEWDCIVLPSKFAAMRCHDFLARAVGYYDGNAVSPHLVAEKADKYLDMPLEELIENNRVELFFNDNALDEIIVENEGSKMELFRPDSPIRVLELGAAGVCAVLFPKHPALAIEAKSYWQHTGEVVSSRRAECALIQLGVWKEEQNNNSNTNMDTSTSSCILSNLRVTAPFFSQYNKDIIVNRCKDLQKQNEKYKWETCKWSKSPHLALHPSSLHVITPPSTCFEFKNKHHSKISATSTPHDDKANKDSDMSIKERIASITCTSPRDIFLTPSGMASIYSTIRSARRRKLFAEMSRIGSSSLVGQQNFGKDAFGTSGGGSAVVFGFPYLDTLKMCSRPEIVPDGVQFFGHGNSSDLNKLESFLEQRRKHLGNQNNHNYDKGKSCGSDANVSILLTEYPSNPLLNCPNLHTLRQLANEYDFALVVDDTIGNFANLDLLSQGYADVLCTSLTKLFNGRGDAIAGSIICNPHTPIGTWMIHDMTRHEILEECQIEGGNNVTKNSTNSNNYPALWESDALAVYLNSSNFLQRSSRINHTAEILATYLKNHDDVMEIYYPKFGSSNRSLYNSVLRHSLSCKMHTPGYGGLLSIILHPHVCQRTFYDKLNVAKGPSLGTDFTLVCPYTLLAHYHELDFAMQYGVTPNLIRIAVGLEEPDTLIQKFEEAFRESRLYPKLCSSNATATTATTSSPSTPSSSDLGHNIITPNPVIGSVGGNRRFHSITPGVGPDQNDLAEDIAPLHLSLNWHEKAMIV